MSKPPGDMTDFAQDYIHSFPEASDARNFAERVISGGLPEHGQYWPNVADHDGVTPVIFLQRRGAEGDAAARALLALEKLAAHPLFDLNHCDRDGNTMLHYAAQNGHAEMVTCLLAHKADATIRNRQGRTAAELAAGKQVESLFAARMKREKKTDNKTLAAEAKPLAVAPEKKDIAALQQEIQLKMPDVWSNALLTSLIQGDDPVAVKDAMASGADIFSAFPNSVPGGETASQIWQLALILRREKAFGVMLALEPALCDKDPASKVYQFIDNCGYSQKYKPVLWNNVAASFPACEQSPSSEWTEEKWLALLHANNTGSKPLTPGQATRFLLTVLQEGDYPKTVQYLIRHGADASAPADAPPHVLNIGRDRVNKGCVWQWAIERGRVKSFEQICLWTQDWHKNKKRSQLEQDAVNFRKREGLMTLARNISNKRKDHSAEERSADYSWLVRGVTYAQLREKYATTKEETLRLVFSIAAGNGQVDEMTAAGAELMSVRKNWLGNQKVREPINGRDAATAMLRALMREDYLFAEALGEKRGYPFNPSPEVKSAFNKSASPEAKIWLKENTRTGYISPPPPAISVRH